MSMTNADIITPPRSPTVIASGATATDLGVECEWLSFVAVGGALTMRFGDATVGAATANDWPLASGVKERFYITSGTRYVSIQGTGALHWVRS